MSKSQNESSVLGDSLATIIVVTTPRNEPSCDTSSSEPSAWKKKTHTHTHSCVSGGNPLETMSGMLGDLRGECRGDLTHSKSGHERRPRTLIFLH